jgi:hypothetical protein
MSSDEKAKTKEKETIARKRLRDGIVIGHAIW